ncbi:MAG: cobalt-precorrin-6A reductase [Actinomycetota bacterium]
MNVLILGGTSEARALAAHLVTDHDMNVVSSLAGRVSAPKLPVGAVRIGGFGGVDGLRAALSGIDVVVDATHPYATTMSTNATTACRLVPAIPLLRLHRPAWTIDPAWHEVSSYEEAARLTASLGERPFLTVGRQELPRFIPTLEDHAVLARLVENPTLPLPERWKTIFSRGPYLLDDELTLMRARRIDVLVSKNSGGTYTWPKMVAAAKLTIPVVVIRRPPGTPDVRTVDTVEEAITWVLRHDPDVH